MERGSVRGEWFNCSDDEIQILLNNLFPNRFDAHTVADIQNVGASENSK